MEFKGHQKTSFIDYPNKVSTVLFTGGCNFRCPYCHNVDLVNNLGEEIQEDYIFAYLKKRKKMIDAVCISGGEATLHSEIYDFIKKVKEFNYLVKLDTNGTNPDILKKLINEKLLDYIAMDIKAPFEKYSIVTDSFVDIKEIKESIDILKKSEVDYEFRTTICKELFSTVDMLNLVNEIQGAKRYIIQNFRDGETVLAGRGKFTPFKREELKEIEMRIKDKFEEFKVRA